jgi:hypothetical protein
VIGIHSEIIKQFIKFSFFLEEENIADRLLQGGSSVNVNWAGICAAMG